MEPLHCCLSLETQQFAAQHRPILDRQDASLNLMQTLPNQHRLAHPGPSSHVTPHWLRANSKPAPYTVSQATSGTNTLQCIKKHFGTTRGTQGSSLPTSPPKMLPCPCPHNHFNTQGTVRQIGTAAWQQHAHRQHKRGNREQLRERRDSPPPDEPHRRQGVRCGQMLAPMPHSSKEDSYCSWSMASSMYSSLSQPAGPAAGACASCRMRVISSTVCAHRSGRVSSRLSSLQLSSGSAWRREQQA